MICPSPVTKSKKKHCFCTLSLPLSLYRGLIWALKLIGSLLNPTWSWLLWSCELLYSNLLYNRFEPSWLKYAFAFKFMQFFCCCCNFFSLQSFPFHFNGYSKNDIHRGKKAAYVELCLIMWSSVTVQYSEQNSNSIFMV